MNDKDFTIINFKWNNLLEIELEIHILESSEGALADTKKSLDKLSTQLGIKSIVSLGISKVLELEKPGLFLIDSKLLNSENLALLTKRARKNTYIAISKDPLKKQPPNFFISSIIIGEVSEKSLLSSIRYSLEILKLKKQLYEIKINEEANSKMYILGEMTATLAHEINNPLTIILGQIGLLKKHFPKKDNQKLGDGLQKIEKTVLRITNIIKSLKFYSRDDSDDPPEHVNLQSIIEEVVVISKDKLNNAGIDFQLEMNEDFKILCRDVQISQILLNLFQNSYDAVKNEADSWINISVKREGENVSIRVSDSGENIANHMDDSIFEPFFTTKAKGSGTGLGLSLSKRIAIEHGGDLILLKGTEKTTFELKLKAS